MRDDDLLTGAERHVRAVLRPGDERIPRVIAAALSSRRERGRRRRLGFIAAGLVLALTAAGMTWRAFAPAPAPSGLHISGSGSVLVVTSDDGRRWVIDARRDSKANGAYMIAFPQ